MAENLFKEVELPQQVSPDGTSVFPAVLIPNPNHAAVNPLQPSVLTEAIKSHKPWLESLLHRCGAILFRGFPLTAPFDFNDFVQAFGYPEMPYVGGGASRTHVVGRVYTANEAPPDQTIPFHNEMAYVPEFPLKLFFFCEVEPGCGGETPIALSHIIYGRMKEKHPEFVAQLEEHGLLYTRVMGEKDDPSSAVGRGWQLAFSTKDKSIAEERAAKLGIKMEWMDDAVKLISGPIPAIRFDSKRQRKVWFNSMLVLYKFPEDAQSEAVIPSVTFGNGKPLPAHIMREVYDTLDEECAVIPWQKGDVMLLDNLAVLHSRRPIIKPPRRVLASLCK